MNRLKIIAAVAALVLPLQAFAVDSSTVLNTTNGSVFNISYESGPATVTVVGVVSATAINSTYTNISYGTLGAGAATFGGVAVQTNANIVGATTTATLRATGVATISGIATFAATQTVFSAAAAIAPTNTAAASLQFRVNGTNYIVPLYIN